MVYIYWGREEIEENVRVFEDLRSVLKQVTQNPTGGYSMGLTLRKVSSGTFEGLIFQIYQWWEKTARKRLWEEDG